MVHHRRAEAARLHDLLLPRTAASYEVVSSRQLLEVEFRELKAHIHLILLGKSFYSLKDESLH